MDLYTSFLFIIWADYLIIYVQECKSTILALKQAWSTILSPVHIEGSDLLQSITQGLSNLFNLFTILHLLPFQITHIKHIGYLICLCFATYRFIYFDPKKETKLFYLKLKRPLIMSETKIYDPNPLLQCSEKPNVLEAFWSYSMTIIIAEGLMFLIVVIRKTCKYRL